MEGRVGYYEQDPVTLTVSKNGFDLKNAPYVMPVTMDMGDYVFEMYSRTICSSKE